MVSTLERTEETSVKVQKAPFFVSEAASEEIVDLAARARAGVVVVRSAEGRGAGAGVIWRSDGGIVTNAHVVAHSRGGLVVTLNDGREFPARVVNQNSALDLALLQVDATDLPAAPVADSTHLRVGELVFAIGHPWGQRDSVTSGIVSGLGQIGVPHTGRKAQYIRSDVALGPGNSGGPLLSARGEVVGINAMVFGGDMGVAIPSHVTTQWVAGPPSRKVYLGVGVRPVELPGVDTPYGSGRAAGLLITGVEEDSPAYRAGVLVGDVVLTAGDEPVPDGDSLLHALATRKAKEMVTLHIMRGEGLREIDVELGEAVDETAES